MKQFIKIKDAVIRTDEILSVEAFKKDNSENYDVYIALLAKNNYQIIVLDVSKDEFDEFCLKLENIEY